MSQVTNLRFLIARFLKVFMRWLVDRFLGMIFGIGFGAFIGVVGGTFRAMPATGEFDIINFAALFALVFGAVGLALGFEKMKEFVKRVQWWD
jgi:hypothetical protein